jgi:hypothetical protein
MNGARDPIHPLISAFPVSIFSNAAKNYISDVNAG